MIFKIKTLFKEETFEIQPEEVNKMYSIWPSYITSALFDWILKKFGLNLFIKKQ